MRIKFNKIILLLLLCFLLFSCITLNSDLEMIEGKPGELIQSGFQSFEVLENKVYFKCRISIKNNTENDIRFKINAISKEDVNTGLLKNENLIGYKENLIDNIFTIKAKEILVNQIVIFVGDFAGNYQKMDRKLPDKINIVILE